MIKLIVGPEGGGKTRKLIETANQDIKKIRGHSVYIDYQNTRMMKVDYKIRFINVGEYKVRDKDSFYGFICGIVASNYDIETIYNDGLCNITNTEFDYMEDFFRKLDILELKYNISFIMTISSDKENIPEFLNKYIIIE